MPVSDEEFNKALNVLAVAYEVIEAVQSEYLEDYFETLGQDGDHWWAIGLNNAAIWHLLTENWSRMHAQDVAWAEDIIEHPWRADLFHLVGKRKARVLAIAQDKVNEGKLAIEQDMKVIARRMLDSAVRPVDRHMAQERIRQMQKVSHTWDMDAR
jgi:hypothetical protein